jgi:hypothetical protein
MQEPDKQKFSVFLHFLRFTIKENRSTNWHYKNVNLLVPHGIREKEICITRQYAEAKSITQMIYQNTLT